MSAESSHCTVFPYISTLTTVNDAPTSVDRLARCIEDLAAWLSASRLRLNPTKTQVLWLGSKYQVDRITVRHVPVLSSSVQVADSARDLGVVIDSHLTMVDHVTAARCLLSSAATTPDYKIPVCRCSKDTCAELTSAELATSIYMSPRLL